MSKPLQVEVVLSHSEHLPVVDVWLVIDVLRASTVMVSWFAEGGAELYPAGSVEAAERLAEALRLEGKKPLLMGEQNAIAPQGFDLGNSPLDITRDRVQKYSCAVMATTNGTQAILKAASTGTPVLIACPRNASAALELALGKGNRIGVFCSGRKGRPAWDDTLCAGLLIACLTESYPGLRLADSARLAHLAWQSAKDFQASLRSADHAIFLDKIGYGDDISFAAEIDAVHIVPELREIPDGDGMRAVLFPAASGKPAPSVRQDGAGQRGLLSAPPEPPGIPVVSARAAETRPEEKPLSAGDAGDVFFAGEVYRKQRQEENRKKNRRF